MAVARIKPKIPHFFTPILPASCQELMIPKAFCKYLVGENCEEGEATLRTHRLCGMSWPVKLKGFCFREGWPDFVRDNDLQLGDFVVFGYEGSMVFDVIVFDSSFCEKKYPPLHVRKKAQNKSKSPPSKRVMTRSKGEQAAKSKECPSFTVTIREFNLFKKLELYIPCAFAKSNGLTGKRCEVIMRDEKGRPWPVMLNHRPSDGRVCIGTGWLDFSRANNLKKDDDCVFKCTSQDAGGKMVFDVKVLDYNDPRVADQKKKKNNQSHEQVQRITSFKTSLKPFNLKESRLTVPRKVVRSSGLANITLETILTDANGNSWPVKLKNRTNDKTCICGDWKEISASSGLKVGDSCNLELIKKGKKKPVEFRMH